MEFPLPWERLLWRGHSLLPPRTHSTVLTDFGWCESRTAREDELAIYDLGGVQTTRSWVDRLLGTSTLIVTARDDRRSPLVLRHIRRGAEVAAVLELLVSEPHQTLDVDAAPLGAAVATVTDEPRTAAGCSSASPRSWSR